MRLALTLYPWSDEWLSIGKFCQIAHGVQIVTSSANHRYEGLSSFPFAIFDRDENWLDRPSMPNAGADTVIGHDVWIGTSVLILPGAVIGDGVIIGAGVVVGGTTPPYYVIAGNPVQVIRARLTSDDAARMQEIAWWNWPIEDISVHETEICGTDLDAPERVSLEIAARHG